MVAVSLTDTNERNSDPNLFCTKSTLPSNKAFAMFKARLSFFTTLLNLALMFLSKQPKISKLGILAKTFLLVEWSLDNSASSVFSQSRVR